MLEAERRCRKLKMGHTAWTPAFADLKRERKAWLTVVKQLNPNQNIRTYWHNRLVASGKIVVPPEITLEQAEANLAETKRRTARYKTNSNRG
jgi:hypothetical protein